LKKVGINAGCDDGYEVASAGTNDVVVLPLVGPVESGVNGRPASPDSSVRCVLGGDGGFDIGGDGYEKSLF